MAFDETSDWYAWPWPLSSGPTGHLGAGRGSGGPGWADVLSRDAGFTAVVGDTGGWFQSDWLNSPGWFVGTGTTWSDVSTTDPSWASVR